MTFPAIAATVSERSYEFEHNVLGFRRFRLTFGEDLVVWEFWFRDKAVEVEVGTDGEPRMTESEGHIRSYRGQWSSADTFAMSYEIMGTEESGGIEITFRDDAATVLFFEHGTGMREVMTARRLDDAPAG